MKRNICMIFAIACVLSIVPEVLPDEKVNLLVNPGFEEGLKGWDDWSGSEFGYPKDTINIVSPPPADARSGKRAAGKLLPDTLSTFVAGKRERWSGFSQTVACSGKGCYYASGYIISKPGEEHIRNNAKAFIEVKCLDKNGNVLKTDQSKKYLKRDCDWMRFSVDGKMPSRARSIVFSFVLTGGARARGAVLFDDAHLYIER